MLPLWVAAGVSAAASLVARWAGTLTGSGAVAAWTVGLLVLAGTGWQGGAILAAFFIASNLVSRLSGSTPAGPDPKGDRRDAWQVYANGSVAAAGAALSPAGSSLGIWLVTCTLAAAAADTWATSIGGLSRVPPRLLGLGRTVVTGTSGGMTLMGSVGAAAGALIVAASGAVAAGISLLLPAATLIGFLGMVVDSALGAFLQGRFHCKSCNESSEWQIHRCGGPTAHVRGLAWLNNDGVNLVATAVAGGAAVGVWLWLSPG